MSTTGSAVDRYIESTMNNIRGMSGPFSLKVVCGLLNIQAEHGLTGDAVEVGVFEGRFLIGLALALEVNEIAIGIDSFNWPDAGVQDRTRLNIRSVGIEERVELRSIDTREAKVRDLARQNRPPPRLIHIDADHTYESLSRDLRLARQAVSPKGAIVIDDMLHPGYPELYDAVRDVLQEDKGWSVFCIVDREDIVASTKFLIADVRMGLFYSQHLQARFQPYVWKMGAAFRNFKALVLAKDTRLADVGP